MKKLIKGLIIFSALSHAAFAQNTYQNKDRGTMSKDSTDLVPFDALNLIPPTTTTATTTGTYPGPTFNGQCGASNNSILTSSPTSFLCSKGTASAVIMLPNQIPNNGGIYNWSCTGNNTSSPSNVATCSAQQRVVGQCGSDNGQTLSSTPTSLCASGAPSSVSNNGSTYSWSCSGNYGAPASCSAIYQIPFTFGAIEERLVSCDEWNTAFMNGNMANPHNPPGTTVIRLGEIVAIADTSGWYAIKLYGAGGGLLGYGGAVVNRQAAYLNGTFHHWVNGSSNDGWTPAKVGVCTIKM